MKKRNLIDIALVLSILVAMVVALWYIFGNSPTSTQLIFSFIVPMFFLMFKQYDSLSRKIDTNKSMIYKTRERVIIEMNGVKKSLEKIERNLKK